MTPQLPGTVAVIVLAGGDARRFGSDKLTAPLGDYTVLDTLLDSLPTSWEVVAVGPMRSTRREVTWTRESPPGGGPLAGIAAGLACVAMESVDFVTVVAGDMPWATPGLIGCLHSLSKAAHGVGAVISRDHTGRVNPLLAAYRTSALRQSIPTRPDGLPARTLLTIPHDEFLVDATVGADIDTPADLPPQAERQLPDSE